MRAYGRSLHTANGCIRRYVSVDHVFMSLLFTSSDFKLSFVSQDALRVNSMTHEYFNGAFSFGGCRRFSRELLSRRI